MMSFILSGLLVLQAVVYNRQPVNRKPVIRTVKIMSYNIMAANRGVAKVVKTIKVVRPDIVMLQEVDRNVRRTGRRDQPAMIARSLGFNMVFRKHFNYQGGQFGLAVLSRYKIDQVERIQTHGSNLIMLKARVHTPGKPVYLLNVHFHPVSPLLNGKVRKRRMAARAREATRAYNLFVKLKLPAMIVGDFNSTPDTLIYRKFSSSFGDACKGAGATWPARLPLVRIDYIWVNKLIRIRHCRTVSSFASDHRPVVAEMIVSP